ncbi:hypothetical protein V3C99_012931 [Haemonchus contortus]
MPIIVTDIFQLTGMAEPPYAEFDKMVNITAPSDKIDQWAEKMASQLLRTARQEKEEEEGPQFPSTGAPKYNNFKKATRNACACRFHVLPDAYH